MTMTKAEILAARQRWRAAAARTKAIYIHVGALATHFAGLEIEVLELIAKFAQRAKRPITKASLSNMPFSQSVTILSELVQSLTTNTDILKDASTIADDLQQLANARNDILHSSWIAYSTGDYGQHRARVRPNLPQKLTHRESPTTNIDGCIKKIEEMYWRLCSLEDDVLNRIGEPGG